MAVRFAFTFLDMVSSLLTGLLAYLNAKKSGIKESTGFLVSFSLARQPPCQHGWLAYGRHLISPPRGCNNIRVIPTGWTKFPLMSRQLLQILSQSAGGLLWRVLPHACFYWVDRG